VGGGEDTQIERWIAFRLTPRRSRTTDTFGDLTIRAVGMTGQHADHPTGTLRLVDPAKMAFLFDKVPEWVDPEDPVAGESTQGLSGILS
jgi:hypothetical protein